MKNYLSIALLTCLLLSSCTKDIGTITMTFNKSTAKYGDLEQIRNIPLVETPQAISNSGKIFVGEEFLLIGEEGRGIHVFDNSNINSPTNVAFLNVPLCKEFYVKDNFIYAESQYDMMKIDISDFRNPSIHSRAKNAFAQPFTNDNGYQLIGFDHSTVTEKIKINSKKHEQLGESETLYFDYQESLIPPSAVPSSFSGTSSGSIGTVNRITEKDGYVYAVSNSKIFVFNNTGTFTKANEVQTHSQLETIYPQGDYLFLGSRSSMDIYNVSNPENPIETGSYDHTTSCDPVLPHGNIAYVTLRTGDFSDCPGDVNALMVLDISNIQSPNEVQEIELSSPYGMAINDGILYVGNGANGLEMFNIDNPSSPVRIATDNSVRAYDVIVHPTIPNFILTSGPNGIEQYEFNAETLNLSLISRINS